MEKYDLEQSLCVLPWIQLLVDEKGEVLPCCISKNTSFLDKEGRPILFQNANALKEINSSPTILEIKKDMLNGIRPASCEQCWKTESLNITSYRQDVNEKYSSTLKKIVKKELNENDFEYQWLDLRLGNFCNLKCRMCYPTSSSALTKDHFKVYKKKYSQDLDFDWYKNLDRINELFDQGHTIDRLHLAGGEPLLIKEGFQLLEKLIAGNYSSNIELTYNTNLTVIPESAFSLWRHFKKVTLIISIDGTDQINNYIRYPSDWHKLLKNIATVEAEQINNPKLDFNFHVTVMSYNALNLKNLIRFFDPFLKKNIYPRFDFVHGVEHFSIAHLPRILKEQAILDLEKILSERSKIGGLLENEFQNNLKGIILKLKEKQNIFKTAELIRVTNEYDLIRKQSLTSLVPEYKTFMNSPTLKIMAKSLSLLKSLKALAYPT